MGAPLTTASSLLTAPMRRDCPAASTTAATGGGRRAAGGATCRVFLSPPTPRAAMRRESTGIPAASRSSRRSKLLRRAERALPGATRIGRSPHRASRVRCPGSTGMPSLVISPPAPSMPRGTQSRRSTVAEAPIIRRRSMPPLRRRKTASVIAASWCSQHSSATSEPPSDSTRALVTAWVLSRIAARVPRSRVWMRPALRALNAVNRHRGRQVPAQIHHLLLAKHEGHRLERRHHLAPLHPRQRHQRGERQAFPAGVERLHPGLVDLDKPRPIGEEPDPAVAGSGTADPASCQPRRDGGRGRVLVEVTLTPAAPPSPGRCRHGAAPARRRA